MAAKIERRHRIPNFMGLNTNGLAASAGVWQRATETEISAALGLCGSGRTLALTPI